MYIARYVYIYTCILKHNLFFPLTCMRSIKVKLTISTETFRIVCARRKSDVEIFVNEVPL